MNIIALIVTTLAGLSFLIGLIINSVNKNKKALYILSISLAFSVMLGLIAFDLLPELIENISEYSTLNKLLITSSSVLLGFLVLKLLDIIIPHHHHDHHQNKDNIIEHNGNMYHIGLITSIALIVHNIIEGGSIYLNSIIDIKTGILIALGVGLHNIPLGVEICTTLNLSKQNFSKKILPISLISLSTSLGALLIILININNNILFVTYLIGITIGMLGYLILFELLKEIKQNYKNKYTIIGLLTGIIIIFISSLI
jgi:ZIP family zinc transporter